MPRAKTPAAEYKKLMLRLPADVLESFHRVADENFRSMNAQILHVLTDWLAQGKRHTAERQRRERTAAR